VSEREDLGVGVYATLSGLVVLISLVGAFVLPPSFIDAKWLGILVLLAFFVGIPVLLYVAHRSRIRDAVEKLGGGVIRIKKLPFWRQRFCSQDAFFLGLRFKVEYVDMLGLVHRAMCNSGFFQGVEWLEDVVIDAAP
jgi:hypothetical protein